MKTMTCKQLEGACDESFSAETFEEIAEMSKRHGVEMFQKRDEEHLKAMEAMENLMQCRSGLKARRKNLKLYPTPRI